MPGALGRWAEERWDRGVTGGAPQPEPCEVPIGCWMWFPNRIHLWFPITGWERSFLLATRELRRTARRCCQREKRPQVGLVEVGLAGRQRGNPNANRTSAAVEIMTIDRVSMAED